MPCHGRKHPRATRDTAFNLHVAAPSVRLSVRQSEAVSQSNTMSECTFGRPVRRTVGRRPCRRRIRRARRHRCSASLGAWRRIRGGFRAHGAGRAVSHRGWLLRVCSSVPQRRTQARCRARMRCVRARVPRRAHGAVVGPPCSPVLPGCGRATQAASRSTPCASPGPSSRDRCDGGAEEDEPALAADPRLP